MNQKLLIDPQKRATLFLAAALGASALALLAFFMPLLNYELYYLTKSISGFDLIGLELDNGAFLGGWMALALTLVGLAGALVGFKWPQGLIGTLVTSGGSLLLVLVASTGLAQEELVEVAMGLGVMETGIALWVFVLSHLAAIITAAAALRLSEPEPVRVKTVPCPHCGRQNDPAAAICPHCGKRLQQLPEPKKTLVCRKCGRHNDTSALFCRCGFCLKAPAEWKDRCPRCSTRNSPDARHCRCCGHRLTPASQPPQPRGRITGPSSMATIPVGQTIPARRRVPQVRCRHCGQFQSEATWCKFCGKRI